MAEQLSLILEPQEGDARPVRADRYNFAVERYSRVKSRNGEPDRFEWQVVGYYGSNLPMACQMAIREGAHGGDAAELLDAVLRAEKVVMAYAQQMQKEAVRG